MKTDEGEVAAALHVALLALVSIRHEPSLTSYQAQVLDAAIKRGAKALGIPGPFEKEG